MFAFIHFKEEKKLITSLIYKRFFENVAYGHGQLFLKFFRHQIKGSIFDYLARFKYIYNDHRMSKLLLNCSKARLSHSLI